jgi:N-acetylmuramoyl-L-alanine amidase
MLPLEGSSLDRHQLLAEAARSVFVPPPRKTLPCDTLRIAGDYGAPSGDLVLASGDMLPVMFQGTPGMFAWCSIPGVADSIPMSEMAPRQQPYWGESVFGAGAVPDSVLIGGVYAGFYRVTDSVSIADANIVYHLKPPPLKYLRPLITQTEYGHVTNADLIKYLNLADSASRQSGYRISLNSPDYPATVQLIDSVQTIRYGPRLGYFAIFQPKGVQALVVGRDGDWFRLRLSQTHFAWAHRNSVMPLGRGILPPVSKLAAVRSYGFGDHVLLEFGLGGKHSFRVYADDPRTLRLQLFGVISNTDWIRYDFSDSLIDLATWSQPENGLYEFKLQLSQDLWGYDTYYEGNTFYLKLNRPPDRTRYLWGKTVVIDPGHSSDPGAIGPTGLTEARANLGIALAVERELERRDAEVVMTRDDMRHVALYDRPAIAKLADADLFVSIHNNALPDGVNPFTNHGVSTLYYHPHSAPLARAIQKELLRATGMPDFGLYHGNLAVNRPTQYPAVLVECAFMMIPEQEANLKEKSFQRKLARAIADGIEAFLEQYHDDNVE